MNQRREADLSAILSAPQKRELLSLVSSITNTMQEQVCQYFGPQAPPLTSLPPNSTSSNPSFNEPAAETQGNAKSAYRSQTQPHGFAQPDSEHAELKKEALAAFQKWQSSLTKRVCEVSVGGEQPPLSLNQQGRVATGKQTGKEATRRLGRPPLGFRKAGGPSGSKGCSTGELFCSILPLIILQLRYQKVGGTNMR